MKYTYTIQASAIQKALESLERRGVEKTMPMVFEASREAQTFLLALALMEKRYAINDDLIKLAEEFVADAPSMDLTELVEYQWEFRKLLEKLK